MWEIELKVPASDPAGLERRLDLLAPRGGSFFKEDVYYCPATDPNGPTAFRIRLDGGVWVVTHKSKTINPQGIEESRETEFGVSDAKAFDRFACELGYVAAIRKTKKGRWWQLGPNFKAELSEVPPLGHWLELEILLDEAAAEPQIQGAKSRLHACLLELGLDPDRAEKRPYTQMLREALASGALSS